MSLSFNRPSLQARLSAGLAALGLDAAPAVQSRLLDYLELLVHWNAAYNLTAVREPEEMVTRHLLDSLSIAPLVRGDSLADLGSGAGLPGIPLAILTPQRQHVLIDSNGKKARFLRDAVRTLALGNVRVEHIRVESARGHYACVTARAFATLRDMLRLGGHLLAPGGTWLALKGQIDDAELADVPAGFRIADVRALHVPGLNAARHVIVIERTEILAQDHAA